ncbi:hypothetical protein WN51_11552 [Melipona quadrifasciata]|uniref:Transmembrane protein n=1 Tax=Melipona quadrifasciata TaxID=166423 RepID=A0A0N0BK55_9HYME|nr:hypothetical protein WN51_11552 [Melipona quadrifasciata]
MTLITRQCFAIPTSGPGEDRGPSPSRNERDRERSDLIRDREARCPPASSRSQPSPPPLSDSTSFTFFSFYRAGRTPPPQSCSFSLSGKIFLRPRVFIILCFFFLFGFFHPSPSTVSEVFRLFLGELQSLLRRRRFERSGSRV